MSRPKRRARPSLASRSNPGGLPTSTGALLAALEGATTAEDRARIGGKLALSGVRDRRIRAALVGLLEDDPLNGAAYLSAYGDRTAVAELTTALERHLDAPIADCEICAAEHVAALATAIRTLGGTVSDPQLARVDALMDRASESWVPLANHCAAPSGAASASPAAGGPPIGPLPRASGAPDESLRPRRDRRQELH